MSKISQIENLVKTYMDCAKPYGNLADTRSHFNEGPHIDCPKIFDSIKIEELNHEELSCLSYLLTTTLPIEINSDHKYFWAWCGFLIDKSYDIHLPSLAVFRDDWIHAFKTSLHFLFASERRPENYTRAYNAELRKYINSHFFYVKPSRYVIATPLVFALLEGLLRRKNKDYVKTNGEITQSFVITKSDGKEKSYKTGMNLNSVSDSLNCSYKMLSQKGIEN